MTILDSWKLKDFAENNFKFDENGRKSSKPVENTVEKTGLNTIPNNCVKENSL